MTNPITNQQQPIVNGAQQGQVNQPAPGGVGATQTSMRSLSAESEKGYVETAVHWVIDWVKYIFKGVFCCFYKSEEASPPSQTIAAPTVEAPPRIYNETTVENIELLADFNRLRLDQQSEIYRAIGRDPAPAMHSYERAGRNRVEADPQRLKPYLRPPQTQ